MGEERRLEESVELDTGGNKEGIESVQRREMKGCVGGRGVGVEQRKALVTSPVYPLAPQTFTIKTFFHSVIHTRHFSPLLNENTTQD